MAAVVMEDSRMYLDRESSQLVSLLRLEARRHRLPRESDKGAMRAKAVVMESFIESGEIRPAEMAKRLVAQGHCPTLAEAHRVVYQVIGFVLDYQDII